MGQPGCRQGMTRALLAAALIACTPPVTSPSPTPGLAARASSPAVASLRPLVPLDFTPGKEAQRTASCGSTGIYSGPVPEGLAIATGRNVPRGLRYVVADPPTAAGFLFNDPLEAGRPQKVLWVVGTPRDGPLTIEARHHDDQVSTQILHAEPNAFPGDIYPSSVQVPRAGCWELTLRWRSLETRLDLQFTAPRSE